MKTISLAASAAVIAAGIICPVASAANPETVTLGTQYVAEIAGKYGGPLAPVEVVELDTYPGVSSPIATALSHNQKLYLDIELANKTPVEANAYLAPSYNGNWHAPGCEPLRALVIHEYAHHWEVSRAREPLNEFLTAVESGVITTDQLLNDLHPAAYFVGGRRRLGEPRRSTSGGVSGG